jgi:hypothetical protein
MILPGRQQRVRCLLALLGLRSTVAALPLLQSLVWHGGQTFRDVRLYHLETP